LNKCLALTKIFSNYKIQYKKQFNLTKNKYNKSKNEFSLFLVVDNK